ncbi:hypothetical protein PSI23_13185, partial [Xenorhabdus sp. XENO-10]|nr:hypothetical protein [Xenorhabdus yunnanensis]
MITMLKKQNKPWTDKQRHRLKRVARMTIFAQAAFPVVGAFTPALAVGDEMEGPQSLSHKLLAESLRQASVPETPANETERWLAGAASRAAGMLKSGNLVESTKNQLRGLAVSEANQTLQNWLQRYG